MIRFFVKLQEDSYERLQDGARASARGVVRAAICCNLMPRTGKKPSAVPHR
jgi:hypothetical protein